MPNILQLSNAPWLLSTTLLAAALFSMCRRPALARSWWTVVLYLAMRLVCESTLIYLYARSLAKAYFYTYWTFSFIELALTFLVLGQVLRRVATRRYGSALTLAAVAAAPLISAVVYAVSQHSSYATTGPYPIVQWALLSQRAASIGCALAFAAVAFFLDFAGFSWPRRALLIATAVSVRYLAELVLSLTLTILGGREHRWDSLLHEVMLLLSSGILLYAAVIPYRDRNSSRTPTSTETLPQESLCI